MEIKKLWRLPVPSAGHIGRIRCIDEPRRLMVDNVLWDFGGVFLLFDFDRENKKYNGGVVFGTPQVYRYKSALLAKPLPDSLDTLVEYTNSEWLDALFERNREVAASWGIKHFAIYLNGYGLLEVIAKDFEILTIQEGSLAERFFTRETKE